MVSERDLARIARFVTARTTDDRLPTLGDGAGPSRAGRESAGGDDGPA